ncbi:MAG: hypothetical protein ACYSU5_07840 [Planctomycetota bacterium]
MMNRIVIAALLSVFAAGIPALGADTADGPDLGGKDKKEPRGLRLYECDELAKVPPGRSSRLEMG